MNHDGLRSRVVFLQPGPTGCLPPDPWTRAPHTFRPPDPWTRAPHFPSPYFLL